MHGHATDSCGLRTASRSCTSFQNKSPRGHPTYRVVARSSELCLQSGAKVAERLREACDCVHGRICYSTRFPSYCCKEESRLQLDLSAQFTCSSAAGFTWHDPVVQAGTGTLALSLLFSSPVSFQQCLTFNASIIVARPFVSLRAALVALHGITL